MKRARRWPWLAAVAAASAAGLVAAQPMGAYSYPPSAQPNAPAPPQGGAPASPMQVPMGQAPMGQAPPEEAPPADVAPPAPAVVPPITDKEVEAAPPPAKPAEPEKPAEPLRRARYDVAVLEALDKITAETLVFEAPVGKKIRYKGLIFTVSACERSTPEEPVADSIAYLTIDSQPRAEAGRPTPPSRQVFKGWMYASSPGLHALQHPVYDAWVINCRQAAPAPPAAPPATVASR